jgi:hypothetical protein
MLSGTKDLRYYTGRTSRTADEAYNVAELMALDLAVKHGGEVIGSKVTVSDTDGRKLFVIPVNGIIPFSEPEWCIAKPTCG